MVRRKQSHIKLLTVIFPHKSILQSTKNEPSRPASKLVNKSGVLAKAHEHIALSLSRLLWSVFCRGIISPIWLEMFCKIVREGQIRAVQGTHPLIFGFGKPCSGQWHTGHRHRPFSLHIHGLPFSFCLWICKYWKQHFLLSSWEPQGQSVSRSVINSKSGCWSIRLYALHCSMESGQNITMSVFSGSWIATPVLVLSGANRYISC